MKQNSTARYAAQLAREQALCDAWNVAHPIGTPVKVELDSGEIRETITRSAAQVLCDHAVIWLKGVVGCYALYRVTAIDEENVLKGENHV